MFKHLFILYMVYKIQNKLLRIITMTNTKQTKTPAASTLARRAAVSTMQVMPAHLRGLALAAGDSAALAAAKLDGLELAYAALKDRANYKTLPLVVSVIFQTSEAFTEPTSLERFKLFAAECDNFVTAQRANATVKNATKQRSRRLNGMVQAALLNATNEVNARHAAKLAAAAHAPAKQAA
jgi:hypothetical protein